MLQPSLQHASAEAPPVLVERHGSVAILTLNRPGRRNALSTDMLETLDAAFRHAEEDGAVRAIILAHAGPVFSSGHDLRDVVGISEAEANTLFAHSAALMERLHEIPKPIIAQVQGLASAAGLQLATSCDLIVAAETASFQTPGVKIGLFCSTPMVPLSRTVPPRKALEMLFTGQAMPALEAERIGLVNRVVPADALAAATLSLAEEIVQYSGDTLGLGKRAFYRQLPLDEHAAYAVGREAMARNSQTKDAQEGMSAFLQKRPPRFKN